MPIATDLSRLTLPAMAIAAFALAAPLPSAAQAQSEQPPISAEDLSQTQLESFAAAADQVDAITEQLQADTQDMSDDADFAELQERANLDMVAAIEGQGLTVEEYNMIYQVAQVDPDVNATLMEMMQR